MIVEIIFMKLKKLDVSNNNKLGTYLISDKYKIIILKAKPLYSRHNGIDIITINYNVCV